jgi:hypothetical protein
MSPLVRAAAGWFAGSAGAVGLAALAGWWPTSRLAGAGAGAALAAGCAVALAGALAGAAPVLAAVARGGARRPQAVAGWAMALRFGATLAGALAVALGSELPRRPLLAWVALAYAALLVFETRWTLRWLRAGAT